MTVALIRDPLNRLSREWEALLTQNGQKVLVIEDTFKGSYKNIDLCLALISIKDYQKNHQRFETAKQLEDAGVPMINSTRAIVLSSDKWLTYQAWQKENLLQPTTHLLQKVAQLPNDTTPPCIIKPRFGHSGARVQLVSSLDEAQTRTKKWEDDALLQQYIPEPRSIRVITSQEGVVSCYERVLPGAIAANVALGASRHYFEPDNELINLSKKMLRSLGGGLMGLDVLERSGRYYALEANVPFGFERNNEALKIKLAQSVATTPR